MQNNDLLAGIRAIKNAASEDEGMANSMKLYIDTIIPN